jgi:hypothetical protein
VAGAAHDQRTRYRSQSQPRRQHGWSYRRRRAIAAGAAIWLVLTEPVTIANAVDTGEIAPLVLRLAEAIYQTMAGLLDYL